MIESTYFNLILLGCALVTWLPRIAPFVISKKVTFPKKLEHFLSFLPMCILMALFVSSLFVPNDKGLPTFNFENIIASVPPIVMGILTKSLMVTVIVAIVSMALVRNCL